MLARIYCAEPCTSSVLRARLVAEIEIEKWPDDPARLADDHGGDFVKLDPLDPEVETT